MDHYTRTSLAVSQLVTKRYSTSFSLSSRLFARTMRPHIYAIYGLVRIADEIVDTYAGPDQLVLLTELNQEVYRAIERGYSTNPIVQAFAETCRKYSIDNALIQPFFDSMHMDITPQKYNDSDYVTYIHGSAEVVGLMCLKIFTNNTSALYDQLDTGASALGSAYQKVNFLRDMTDDYSRLGRMYFPGVSYDSFSAADKAAVISNIRADFDRAAPAIAILPPGAKIAVASSFVLYRRLLDKLANSSVEQIKNQRIRISDIEKFWLLVKTALKRGRV